MNYPLLNRLFNNPTYFRNGFIGLLLFSVILNSFLLQGDNQLYILYIFSVIFLGIGFFNKPVWLLALLTLIVVVCRYFFIPEPESHLGIFLIHLLTYLLITLISASLMKYIQKVKEDNLELTTALANALDSRDAYTMHHSANVAKYSMQIAEKMNLSKENCEIIHKGALLHDIGKIGIPEHILKKNKKLTSEEYEIIKSHPKIGYEMIEHVGSFHNNGILDIVLYHHERYDGKGYPLGLKGNQIPLYARIVAVADTFDAMTTKRVYRDKLSLDYTLHEIWKNKGSQFDPEVVDVFLSLFDRQLIEDNEGFEKRLKSS
jgi:putative nucleotidyltransferase with HDIG domain